MPFSLDMLFYIGATLFVAFIFKVAVSDRFRFPAVTLYVVVGVIVGISVLRVYTSVELDSLDFVTKLGVGVIAFLIGTGTVLLFYPDKPEYAIILGAVSSATAPAATVFVIRQFKAKGPLTSTMPLR